MNFLRYIFSFACFLSAFVMTIYGCYKYWKDENLCVVDYKHFENSREEVYPILSLCFSNIIIEHKLKEYNHTFNVDKYIEYLKGDAYYDGMETVDFENVTLQLHDFVLGHNIWYKDGREKGDPNPNIIPKITYTGFFNHFLLNKCFGVKMHEDGIAQRYFGLNTSIFPNGVRPDFFFSVHLHMKGKFILSEDTRKDTWPKGTNITTMRLNLNQMEVIKRRDKRHEPCVSDQLDYDEQILTQHLRKIGCRAPYQEVQKYFPICKTNIKMKEADYFNTASIKACSSLEGVIYRYEEANFIYGIIQSPLWIGLRLPNTFKEILMVKAVDIQTVIGNAGGYVGLFLSNTATFLVFYQLSQSETVYLENSFSMKKPTTMLFLKRLGNNQGNGNPSGNYKIKVGP